MSHFSIKKGKNLKIKGSVSYETVDLPLPKQVAVMPPNFKGLKSRLAVKVDDVVKVGSPVITDKSIEGLLVSSPVSGKVVAINRGAKRSLLEVVIETDNLQETISFLNSPSSDASSYSSDQIKKTMLESGLWAVLRQRPFSKIANPSDKPKSLFIHAMNTEPLAADIDYIMEDKDIEYQFGIDILKKLVGVNIHQCIDAQSKAKALKEAKNVETHTFSGPHPAGNIGTHIHCVDPIGKGDVVWFIEVQDVLRVAQLFQKGTYPVERTVAISGEGAKNRVYTKTIVGTPLSSLLQGSDLQNMRCISGSVLTGRNVGKNGYLGFYDSQVTIIPEGGSRKLLGWLVPGFNNYTFSRTYASAFTGKKDFSLDADKNGSDRAIVLNHLYDELNALDIMTYFLLKSVISEDIEESEKLGILECDEEDFALCTFACPSKIDVGGIIQSGLEIIEKEG